MKQLLFLLLFPCLAMAQYPGNAGQKITLGEQTTADGLVFRGVANLDTVAATSKITRANKQDTSAFLLLDTTTNLLWHYKIGSNAWTQAGGGDTSLIAYVNTYGTQTVNGAKTFTSAVTGARFNPTENTATGTGMFLPAANSLGLSTYDIKRLEINETGATTLTNSAGMTNGNGLNLRSGGSSASDANVLNFTSNTGTINLSMFSDAANGFTRLKSLGNLSLHTGNIGISADNERISITPTGDVGIGITTPLQTSTNRRVLTLNGTSTILFNMAVGGNVGAYWYNDGSYSQVYSIGQFDFVTASATPVTFTPNNVERMRVTSDGEVWIGYTEDNGAYPLQVNGQIFATNATIATSDEKFKENITPLNKGLEIVNKLKPVTFNFISDTENNFSEYEEVGFIAQDVDRALSTETFAKSIVKAADDSEPTSTMGLATQNLIPILVKAIQEQQTLIKALEQRILILENK